MPAIPDNVLSSPSRLGELRREPLDPPVDAHVVHLDAALGEEFFDVPIGKAEPKVPADCQGDDLGRDAVPGEGRAPNDGDNHLGRTILEAPVVRSVLTEKELADEFVAAFASRLLLEKFFYWLPLSVRAWLDLCSDGDYRNYVRSRSLIATSCSDLAALVAFEPLEVLSLGSGQ